MLNSTDWESRKSDITAKPGTSNVPKLQVQDTGFISYLKVRRSPGKNRAANKAGGKRKMDLMKQNQTESIFEDGYLKTEFINNEYRGLVGWPCKTNAIDGLRYEDKLYGMNGRELYFLDVVYSDEVEHIKIKEFSAEDIPEGELVWVYLPIEPCSWELAVLTKDLRCMTVQCKTYSKYRPVPYLIAKTAEDAERLKNWDVSK